MKTMNPQKLLIEQIGLVSKQLNQEHGRYIAQKKLLKARFADPRLLLVGGLLILFIGIKIPKGQWKKTFKMLTRYSVLLVSNRLKKQIVSHL